MSEPSAPLSLLNVFDVETEDGPRRFLCFVDPVIAGARGIDPRVPYTVTDEPPTQDVLGAYEVDAHGKIVSGSFGYNQLHRWFDQAAGPSGVFADRSFYDWLHPAFAPGERSAPASGDPS